MSTKLEGIPQHIIDKVNADNLFYRKIFVLISIPILIVIGLVWYMTHDVFVFGIMLFAYMFGMMAIMTFIAGDRM